MLVRGRRSWAVGLRRSVRSERVALGSKGFIRATWATAAGANIQRAMSPIFYTPGWPIG